MTTFRFNNGGMLNVQLDGWYIVMKRTEDPFIVLGVDLPTFLDRDYADRILEGPIMDDDKAQERLAYWRAA